MSATVFGGSSSLGELETGEDVGCVEQSVENRT
jgi:hypothetical protein